MHYNIVSIINRWKSSGLLDEFDDVKQEVELARYLESAMNILIPMDADDELPHTSGDFVITSLVEIYEMLTIRRFDPSESKLRILADNLRIDKHKIDINNLIERTITIVESQYTKHDDLVHQSLSDKTIRDTIVREYLVEYGTRE